ncbi:hypothetical protein EVAR_7236_1 [Eumeta japonica]|uniref:Uncharacterized protein n=1 Tax=Eumeta variegata TaxID=151549 RepID=A0A4C1T5T6_EUMVA|nr:hypothetical protein EVAR_7236_1 [Eumeta japonica]
MVMRHVVWSGIEQLTLGSCILGGPVNTRASVEFGRRNPFERNLMNGLDIVYTKPYYDEVLLFILMPDYIETKRSLLEVSERTSMRVQLVECNRSIIWKLPEALLSGSEAADRENNTGAVSIILTKLRVDVLSERQWLSWSRASPRTSKFRVLLATGEFTDDFLTSTTGHVLRASRGRRRRVGVSRSRPALKPRWGFEEFGTKRLSRVCTEDLLNAFLHLFFDINDRLGAITPENHRDLPSSRRPGPACRLHNISRLVWMQIHRTGARSRVQNALCDTHKKIFPIETENRIPKRFSQTRKLKAPGLRFVRGFRQDLTAEHLPETALETSSRTLSLIPPASSRTEGGPRRGRRDDVSTLSFRSSARNSSDTYAILAVWEPARRRVRPGGARRRQAAN